MTWLSHLLDTRLFGLRPAGHHATSVLLHVVNAVLLLGLLRRLTGRLWRSAAVAALFALHPLRVESVAWVAERKDVLCGLFWILTLGAYARWCARRSAGRYLALLASFALALMSKPMAVTLPFVLLLLDAWPLGRALRRPLPAALARLIAEKLPLFALAAGSSALTLLAQARYGAIYRPAGYDLAVRVKAAFVAYAGYLGKTFWPEPLVFLYPLAPGGQPLAAALAAAGLLLALTAGALALWRRTPALATGWIWFAGTLVPVAGVVQVGMQAMADRYTYLPHVGLFTALVWGAADLAARLPRLRAPLIGALVAALAALALRTAAQLPLWRDEVTLYLHAATATHGNWLMHYRAAIALEREGRGAEAVVQYEETLRLQPTHVEARLALARLLQSQGRYEEALAHYRQATIFGPNSASAQKGLAALLELRGDLAEAVAHYRAAVRLEPGNAYYRALLEQAIARLNARR
ncbi:MAG TPA: tetratricopeptide repeat protein [bacterium]